MTVTFGRPAAVVLAVAWISIVAGAEVRANCQSTTTSVYESGVLKSADFPPLVTTDFTGAWWLMGYGDPAFGAGIDNGNYPSGMPQQPGGQVCYYLQGCWLYISQEWPAQYYGVSMQGRWLDSRVDGCVNDANAPACMAALFSDQGRGSSGYAPPGDGPPTGASFLGVMTAREGVNRNFSFSGMTLAPMTAPPVANVTDSGGILRVQMGPISIPAGALVTHPSCSTGLVEGFRLYQQVVPSGGAPSKDRKPLAAAGWTIARGGTGPGGTPHQDGSPPRLDPVGCVSGGTLYLATRFAFESGFEAAHLSPNTPPIPCGTCSAVDADGDGARADKCATLAGLDCDDGRADTFPGAPQVCDGVNNDCSDPLWPALDRTNEVDEDGDGLTGCAGDPCPHDAANDADGDAVCGDVDNCPTTANGNQSDQDGDGKGDLCDACPLSAVDDQDGDGLCGDVDNCPLVSNPGQADSDGDGPGDSCDKCPLDPDNDADGDRLCANFDKCPHDAANDADRDGLCADVDPCPLDAANDAEHDGVCANVDVCPFDADPGQKDVDGDGFGDACDLFAPPRSAMSYSVAVHSVAAADFDGDGDLDLASSAGSSIDWHGNVGNGASWQHHTVTSTARPYVFSGSSSVDAADVTGDGQPDILYGGLDGITLYQNHDRGAQWTSSVIAPMTCSKQVVTGDLDGDGDADVAVAATVGCPAVITWVENTASDGTAWSVHTVDPVQRSGEVAIGDFDHDGDSDLAAVTDPRGSTGDTFLTIHLNASGDASSWTPVRMVVEMGSQESMRGLSSADVDGDGDLDLFVSTYSNVSIETGEVFWYENLAGNGMTWKRHGIERIINGFFQMIVADVDGDGDPDALERAFSGNMRWHESRQNGSSWVTRFIAASNRRPFDIAAADVDRDGALDLVTTMFNQNKVEWHPNIGLPPAGVVAVAGPDLTVECASPAGAQVTLDGSGSSPHPDGLPLLYTWSGPFPTVVSTEPLATVTVPPGTHEITLTVSDAAGRTDSDGLRASVVEPAGAQPRLVLSPSLLWPPNHRMVKVNASLEGTCGVGAVLMSVASSEPDDEPGGGDGATTGDIDDVQAGSLDAAFLLRAERRGSGEGRAYNVMFGLPDASGALRPVGATVVVPHSLEGVTEPIDLRAEQTAQGTVIRWTHTGAPSAFNVIRARLPQAESSGNLTSLEAVVCIRSGSTAMDTLGWEDAADPAVGEAFLYLVESDDGASRSAYSTERAPRPYTLSGDCAAGRMGRTGTR